MKGLLSVCLLAALTIAQAQAGDAARGKESSAACAACHGADGNSQAPDFPKIAGQYEDYLYRTLLDYKSGKRKNAIMQAQVANLSKEALADLSAYFAGQPGLHTKR